MNNDINNRVRSKIDTFVTDLSRLIKESALESVRQAMHGDISLPSRSKGQKRSQEEISNTTENVFKFIEANPGSGIEHIGREIGIDTAELMLPIRRLMSTKRIFKKGQKRGTKYSARAPRK
jgi:hypothetical protein